MNIKANKKALLRGMLFIGGFIFASIAPPYFSAQAGVFSLLGLPVVEQGATDVYFSPKTSDPNSQTITLLQAAVNTDPNPAKGGGDITIVDDVALLAETGVSGSIVDVIERPKNGTISVYEVRVGDTISQIAEMFQVSANTIRWANDFEGAITPGQTLIILPVSGVRHIVKSGGTIADIADIYDADVREIALFNGISEDVYLEKGTEILVPHAEIEVKAPVKNSGSKGSSLVIGTPSASTGGGSYFVRPIAGGVKTQGIHGYNAVDIGAPVGTTLYAAAAGQVIIAKSSGWNGGYGSYVVIKHPNGSQTLYAHASSIAVAVGQYVSQGEVIGYSGNSGKSTGPHLHFEVRGATNPF